MDASEFGSEIKARRRTASLLSRCFLGPVAGCNKLLFEDNIQVEKSLTVKGKNDTDQDPRPSIREANINLPSFDLVTIATATDDFALINKIGECGFGHVYKGVLPIGQEIAKKRLAKDSGQGLLEFKNEVIFIAELQHRNLVRLLGCFIHGDEKMLVYEYMPNRSLDLYLFN
ncbi:hypothetical protein SLA2020_415500 [Shorea laevis]